MLSNIQHRFYFGLRSRSVRILIRCSPAKYNLAFLVGSLSSGLHACIYIHEGVRLAGWQQYSFLLHSFSVGFCSPGMWAGFSGVTVLMVYLYSVFDISANGRDVAARSAVPSLWKPGGFGKMVNVAHGNPGLHCKKCVWLFWDFDVLKELWDWWNFLRWFSFSNWNDLITTAHQSSPAVLSPLTVGTSSTSKFKTASRLLS